MSEPRLASARDPGDPPVTPTPAERISAVALSYPRPRLWKLCVILSAMLAVGYLGAVAALFGAGIGILGNNIPAAWGFPIINVAWWIDIAHGGLLVAAGLVLLRRHWGGAVRRIAENVALFAGAVGGSFAVLHTGRPQYIYFLFPYPNNLGLWPQWRSPLMWDFFAILAFLLYTLVFWYAHMVPDLAVLRDRASTRARQVLYGVLALGWRGSAQQWRNYRSATQVLAALAVPMAIAGIGVSAMDFAGGIAAGYHSTMMPVDAIAAALASSLAMVLIFAVPVRAVFHLKDLISERHLDALARLLLASVLVLALAYLYEHLMGWYSADPFERFQNLDRVSGPFAKLFWPAVALQVGVPQLLWWRRIRVSPVALVLISVLFQAGTWLDHYIVIVTSMERGFMTSAWRTATPTGWDWLMLAGSVGLFALLMFVFMRALPVMSVFETRRRDAARSVGEP